MNILTIKAPRWHDRVFLVAQWKVGAENMLRIEDKNFPEPFYLTREQALKYPVETKPTRAGGKARYYAIPINDLETMMEAL